jgi:hypothetical protein
LIERIYTKVQTPRTLSGIVATFQSPHCAEPCMDMYGKTQFWFLLRFRNAGDVHTLARTVQVLKLTFGIYQSQ